MNYAHGRHPHSLEALDLGRGSRRGQLTATVPVCNLVKQFLAIARAQEASLGAMALRSGVSKAAMVNWYRPSPSRAGCSPSLHNFQNVLEALGYELVIRKKRE